MAEMKLSWNCTFKFLVLVVAILSLAATEYVIFSRQTGHSIAHIVSLGIVPDKGSAR